MNPLPAVILLCLCWQSPISGTNSLLLCYCSFTTTKISVLSVKTNFLSRTPSLPACVTMRKKTPAAVRKEEGFLLTQGFRGFSSCSVLLLRVTRLLIMVSSKWPRKTAHLKVARKQRRDEIRSQHPILPSCDCTHGPDLLH